MSVSVLVGTDGQFHCAGTGIIITWEVDGLASIDPNITSRGITTVVSSSSGTVQSTLTVPATSVNNGTTVRCRLFSLSGSTFSNNSTLTVLPGESNQNLQLCGTVRGTVANFVSTTASCMYRYWSCSQSEVQPII